MNQLLQEFNQTMVNTEAMQDYLLGVPRYYACGVIRGVSPYARLLLQRTDQVEFEIRQFIAGQTQSMYHLNRAIRSFLAFDDHSARAMIGFALWAVSTKLLDKEWYEVMPRFQMACQRLQRTFQIQPATDSRLKTLNLNDSNSCR